jgi:hypothetical protein
MPPFVGLSGKVAFQMSTQAHSVFHNVVPLASTNSQPRPRKTFSPDDACVYQQRHCTDAVPSGVLPIQGLNKIIHYYWDDLRRSGARLADIKYCIGTICRALLKSSGKVFAQNTPAKKRFQLYLYVGCSDCYGTPSPYRTYLCRAWRLYVSVLRNFVSHAGQPIYFVASVHARCGTDTSSQCLSP